MQRQLMLNLMDFEPNLPLESVEIDLVQGTAALAMGTHNGGSRAHFSPRDLCSAGTWLHHCSVRNLALARPWNTYPQRPKKMRRAHSCRAGINQRASLKPQGCKFRFKQQL